MTGRDKAFTAACVSTILLVGLGSKKLALAYPDLAWLMGYFGGVLCGGMLAVILFMYLPGKGRAQTSDSEGAN